MNYEYSQVCMNILCNRYTFVCYNDCIYFVIILLYIQFTFCYEVCTFQNSIRLLTFLTEASEQSRSEVYKNCVSD